MNMKIKFNGWMLIGICVGVIALAAGLIILVGQLGPIPDPGHAH
jgi:hypothetical protein